MKLTSRGVVMIRWTTALLLTSVGIGWAFRPASGAGCSSLLPDRLAQRIVPVPRVGAKLRQSLRHRLDREVGRAHAGLELVPGERGRDRRSLSRAGRVRGDRRCAARVTQVVDE